MMHRVVLLSLLVTLALLLMPLSAPLPAQVLLPPESTDEQEAEETPEVSPEVSSDAPDEPSQQPQPSEPVPEEEPASQPEEAPASSLLPETVTLLREDGSVQELSLEDYLWGVVAAEMPAAFQPEALKAQAVAARSYACYQLLYPDGRHPEADVCTDFSCCQAWISREDRLEKWEDDKEEEYAEKIEAAVRETAGEILIYEDQPVLAVFHASSAGSTRSAQTVWGQALPYLVPVSSPEDEEDAPNYYSVVEMTAEEFSACFLEQFPEADLSGSCEGWFSQPEADDSGAPGTFQVGGVPVTAQELRSLCALRSATFEVSCAEDTITFHVTGYGHGVGMSQYGANTMAKEGSSYQEILAHYYPGTELTGP